MCYYEGMDGNYVTFRCPDELRAQMQTLADEGERTLSWMIRRAMQMYVDNAYRAVVDADGKLSYVRTTS